MTNHPVDDMTVTIEDYEHEPIQAEIGAVKVAYRLNSDKVSMDTYGYTASNLSAGVIVDAVGSSRQNDATVYDIGTLNFQQAGPYETCTVTFTLNGEPYTASTVQGAKAPLQYRDGERASELCPQFEVIITFPLGRNNGVVQGVSVGDSLSVQMKSSWAENMVNERFTAACQDEGGAAAVQAQLRKDLTGRSDYVNKGEFVKNTETLYAKAGEDHTVLGDILEQMDKAGANESNSIVTLERNVPQRIRMFIWLEGQDADCISGASMGSFALRIELAGSTIK